MTGGPGRGSLLAVPVRLRPRTASADEVVAYLGRYNLQSRVMVGVDVQRLRRLTAAGIPVIVEQLLATNDDISHFRLVRGYDDSKQCFIVRTLLIHEYRRVLLRDPRLPVALLPLDWPGAAAYTLCRDFYQLAHRSAERHLTSVLEGPNGALPPANAAFYERFGGLEG